MSKTEKRKGKFFNDVFFLLLFDGVNFYELSCWCLSLTSAASALAAVTALTNERARARVP